MKKAKMLSLTASVCLAITFTFSCSSDDGGGNEPTPSSNSSGDVTVFCKQNSGTCSQFSLSTCMELVNAGVAQIVSSCDEPPPPSSSSQEQPPPPPSSSSSLTPPPPSSSSQPPPPPSSSSSLPPPPPSSSSQPPPPPPSSNSIGSWYCDYGPKRTCFGSGCENLIGGGCFEISGPNPSAAECNREWGTITQSCATTGDFCDYGPLTVDNGDKCGGTGYCGGCYQYATNCIADGGSRVSICPESSLTPPTSRPSSSSSAPPPSSSTSSFTDTRDNKVYRTVIIGTQTWMAENLNRNVSGSKCYDNNSTNCEKYGRLYDWATSMQLPASCNNISCSSQISTKHKGICPDGWHIPTDAEWAILVNYAGGEDNAGIRLKATSGWGLGLPQAAISGNGTDNYGFSALPGGKGESDGSFSDISYGCYWWGASENEDFDGAYDADMWYVHFDFDNAYWYSDRKSSLYSVRCLKN